MNPKNKKVFISYAREDANSAKKLYKDLSDAGLEPWLDLESLLPGQRWKSVISDAIRKSSYFIPLLSSNSVGKRGFVQKELKEALDVLDEIPSSEIFVIPVRLNDCDISDPRLEEIHRVDVFNNWDEGLKKVLFSMGVTPHQSNSASKTILEDNDLLNIIESIGKKKCTPVIGPNASIPWIPTGKEIAIRWAEKYHYPFKNPEQLLQVAQFLAIEHDNDLFPKDLLKREFEKISTPDFSLERHKDTPYSVLADLNLPIYITTNYDNFMEDALRRKGKNPVSEFCRWNEDLEIYAKRYGLKSLLDKPSKYVPTDSQPLVYHILGSADVKESMVLTESDFLDFAININRGDEKCVLPFIVRQALITTSLLFIGYDIVDIINRLTLQSIVNSLDVKFQLNNIILLDRLLPENNIDKLHIAEGYINNFIKKAFKMNVYWDSVNQFSTKLRSGWDEFRNLN